MEPWGVKTYRRLAACMGEKKKEQEKRERVEQDCDGDQSFTDTQGRKEREKRRNTRIQLMFVCDATVKSVKRKGRDQRRDEMMEPRGEMQGRVGGTVSATRPVHTAALLSSALSLHGCCSFMIIFPPFAWQMHSQTRPHTNKQSPRLFTVLHLQGSGSSTAIKLCLTALLSDCGHKWSTLKKPSSDAAESLQPCYITLCAGLAQVMNTTCTDQKKGNSVKV